MSHERAPPPPRRLVRIQAASGLVLTVFVGLHLVNALAANFGPSVYDAVQRTLRVLYQFPAFELLAVFAALVVHVGAGIMRMLERRRRHAGTVPARPGRGLGLHRLSAYYLLAVTVGHTVATRLPSLLFDVYPESAGVAFSLWWMPAFFYPYYTLFAASALYHLLYGLGMAAHAVGWRRVPKLAPATVRVIGLLGGAVTLLALLAIGGITYEIPDPRDNDYARLYARYLGIDLTRD